MLFDLIKKKKKKKQVCGQALGSSAFRSMAEINLLSTLLSLAFAKSTNMLKLDVLYCSWDYVCIPLAFCISMFSVFFHGVLLETLDSSQASLFSQAIRRGEARSIAFTPWQASMPPCGACALTLWGSGSWTCGLKSSHQDMDCRLQFHCFHLALHFGVTLFHHPCVYVRTRDAWVIRFGTYRSISSRIVCM